MQLAINLTTLGSSRKEKSSMIKIKGKNYTTIHSKPEEVHGLQ
jgi:hypothetical protein